MKKILLFLVIFCSSNIAIAKDIHVLFIGNSYIMAHNMPKMIEKISQSDHSSNINIITHQASNSNARFVDHFNDEMTIAKIQSQNWDYIIFQEHSNWALSEFNYKMSYRFATKLKNVSHNNTKNTILFVNWARKPRSNWYRGDNRDFFKHYDYMRGQINQRYPTLAKNLKAKPMKIGDYWDFINKKYPNINLYARDNNNPNVAGSYFNALLFYKLLSQSNNIADINYLPENLDEKDAKILKLIVAG